MPLYHRYAACLLACLALSTACSFGPTPRPDPSATQAFIAREGSLDGYLYRNSQDDSVMIASSSTVPAGHVPIEGAVIRATRDTQRMSVSDRSGYFRLEKLPLGTLDVSISTPGKQILRKVTVLYQTRVSLGEPLVSRETAFAAVQHALAQDDTARLHTLVLSPLQPLPAGLTVTPALAGAAGQLPIRSFRTPQWFFYVNPRLESRFAHEVAYYFVDAVTGQLQLEPAKSWPLLNGFEYARNEYAYFDSPDVLGLRPQRASAMMPAPAAVSVLNAFAPAAAVTGPFRTADHVPGCAVPLHHVLVIKGEDRPDMDRDVENVVIALQSQPNTRLTLFSSFAFTEPVKEMERLIRGLYKGMSPCDTFTIYFTGHGVEGGGLCLQKLLKDGKDYTLKPVSTETNYTNYSDTVYAPSFHLAEAPVCHINVILEACFAGIHATSDQGIGFKAQLSALPGRKAMVLAAAAKDEESTADDDNGGVFTQAFLKALNNPALDQDHDGVVSPAEAGAGVSGKKISADGWIRRLAGYGHTPVLWIKPLNPAEICSPPILPTTTTPRPSPLPVTPPQTPSPTPSDSSTPIPDESPTPTPTPDDSPTPTPAKSPTPKPVESSPPPPVEKPSPPPGSQKVLFDNWNTGGVQNNPEGPCSPTVKWDTSKYLTEIANYHWNDGKGARAGRISLRGRDGKIY